MHLGRRHVLAGAAGLVAAPRRLPAAPLAGFTHGVASGEPTTHSLLFWTRFVGATGPVPLRLEVSRRPDFSDRMATAGAVADPAADWTARATVSGLPPGTRFFYRFEAPDGSRSPPGRAVTLPDVADARLTLAVFSCANLGFGWFNAYAAAAADPAVDLAVHLGDYLYEYPHGTYPSAAQTVAGRLPDPPGATVTLADYRARYASYRRDPDLAALHAAMPMIAVWDDHEFTDNARTDGAWNHDPKTEGPWTARRDAAERAWAEWMPVTQTRWSATDAGGLATLIRLETRISGRTAPADLYGIPKRPGELVANIAAFRDTEWQNPSLRILGADQEAWLAGTLATAARRTRHQILIQSVPMGMCLLPEAALGWKAAGGKDAADEVRFLVEAGRAGLPFNNDNWNGFPAQRARILGAAADAGARLLVLSGDSHNGWAYRLIHEGRQIGHELAVPSVTSPGFETWFPGTDPAVVAAAMVAGNEELIWADTSQRGYGRLHLTADGARLEWLATRSPKQRGSSARSIRSIHV